MVGDGVEPRPLRLGKAVVEDKGGIVWQVVENRRQTLVKQRQPMLHAGVLAASTDALVQPVVGARDAESLAVADAEPLDGVLGQPQFVDGRDGEAFDLSGGALGEGVEAADAFDLVAEQVEPHRLCLTRREQIDQAAAHCVLARLHHRIGAAIAVGVEEVDQAIEVQRLALARAELGFVEKTFRRHPLQHRVDGGDQQTRSPGCQLRQCLDPLAQYLRIGRGPVVRQAIPCWQEQSVGGGHKERDAVQKPQRRFFIDGHRQHARHIR